MTFFLPSQLLRRSHAVSRSRGRGGWQGSRGDRGGYHPRTGDSSWQQGRRRRPRASSSERQLALAWQGGQPTHRTRTLSPPSSAVGRNLEHAIDPCPPLSLPPFLTFFGQLLNGSCIIQPPPPPPNWFGFIEKRLLHVCVWTGEEWMRPNKVLYAATIRCGFLRCVQVSSERQKKDTTCLSV